MATKVCTQKECPVLGNCDNDVVTKAFAKVGVCRSMLVTLCCNYRSRFLIGNISKDSNTENPLVIQRVFY